MLYWTLGNILINFIKCFLVRAFIIFPIFWLRVFSLSGRSILIDMECDWWPPLFPYSLREAWGEDEVHIRAVISFAFLWLRTAEVTCSSGRPHESSPSELGVKVHSAGGSRTVSTLNSLVQSRSVFLPTNSSSHNYSCDFLSEPIISF